ncbi:hypothetical protein AD929_13215 [Gluconobacter potus]|uniref:Uncharacterized protein n=1 Tax=Gluconobacter potus TaxID=2724927 RepID=A0A149QS63_9PROT|nr:hypothetical protein [Gluconobacter potus]KXV00156.1 hypothetical protein AD929_13215 [Gluconobacter potus]
MLRYGTEPFLECSTRGERRLSPYNARLKDSGGRTIEELYQARKVFKDGRTGLSPADAKAFQKLGHRATNYEECQALFSRLWDQYLQENPHLLRLLTQASGISDMFGQRGNTCQATELWRIRCAALGVEPEYEIWETPEPRESRQLSFF